MDLIDFCRDQGILIDSYPPIGIWKRYPTEDHPRSKNGAVKYMGTHAFVQNHAVHDRIITWKPDSISYLDQVKYREMAKRESERILQLQKQASDKAAHILKNCTFAHHPYLRKKGFEGESGYVFEHQDGPMLIIPMRVGEHLVGCQMINVNGEKKFLYGQKSSEAEFIIDNHGVNIFCEGYATALSVRLALKNHKVRYRIHVCFSANNLVKLASKCDSGIVIADNDESETGEKAAVQTGLPYWISDKKGEDGNDYHQRLGLFKFSQGIVKLLNQNKLVAKA